MDKIIKLISLFLLLTLVGCSGLPQKPIPFANYKPEDTNEYYKGCIGSLPITEANIAFTQAIENTKTAKEDFDNATKAEGDNEDTANNETLKQKVISTKEDFNKAAALLLKAAENLTFVTTNNGSDKSDSTDKLVRKICKASSYAEDRLATYWDQTENLSRDNTIADSVIIFSALAAAGGVIFDSHLDVLKVAGLTGLTAGSYKSYNAFNGQQPIYENAIKNTQCLATTGNYIAEEIKLSWKDFGEALSKVQSNSKLTNFLEERYKANQDLISSTSESPKDKAKKFIESYDKINQSLEAILDTAKSTRVEINQSYYTISSMLTDIELTLRKEIRGVRPNVSEILSQIKAQQTALEEIESQKNVIPNEDKATTQSLVTKTTSDLSDEQLLQKFRYQVAQINKLTIQYKTHTTKLKACLINI